MIGWLRGVVRVRDPVSGQVVLDVAGVGYQLSVSVQTMAVIPEAPGACEFTVHTHVREEALELFGFVDDRERRMFRLLLSVPGVGPRLAISVLGGLSLPDLVEAISSGDRAMLQRIPGVGKKTAERILLDLSEKVVVLGDAASSASPAASPDAGHESDSEARAVLVNLGWKPRQVETVLEQLDLEEGAPLDEVVRAALQTLMGQRKKGR